MPRNTARLGVGHPHRLGTDLVDMAPLVEPPQLGQATVLLLVVPLPATELQLGLAGLRPAVEEALLLVPTLSFGPGSPRLIRIALELSQQLNWRRP